MDDYRPLGDFPDAVAPLEVVRVGGIDHLHDIVLGRAHAIDIADSMRVVSILECEAQVGRQMMSLAPDRVQNFLDCLANPLMSVERAERRSDFPDRVRMPDRR